MACVRDILASKGSHVFAIHPSASVLEATRAMNTHGVGALVVMDGHRVVGIVTERDVLRRVVGEELLPAAVRVETIMTRDVVCCTQDIAMDEVSRIMRDRRIRHLPVCSDEGRMVGMISIGDINAYHASEQEAQIHFLHEYVYGRV